MPWTARQKVCVLLGIMVLPRADVMAMVYGVSEGLLAVWKRAKNAASPADRGSLKILWGTILVSVALGFCIAGRWPQFRSEFLVQLRLLWLGVFIGGLALRWYSIHFLGRFFTVNVAIAADHQVIQSGPYHYVRHPSYSGALLAFAGCSLSIGNTLSVPVIVVPITLAFIWRIRIEETVLLKSLGESYADYARRTKRLIPGVL